MGKKLFETFPTLYDGNGPGVTGTVSALTANFLLYGHPKRLLGTLFRVRMRVTEPTHHVLDVLPGCGIKIS